MQKKKVHVVNAMMYNVSHYLLIEHIPHAHTYYHAHYIGIHTQHSEFVFCEQVYALVTQQDPGMQLDYMRQDP